MPPDRHDEVRTAFAVLGVSPNAGRSAVTRRYKTLVRRWHPDRFASDPVAVSEATIMLRAINHAYGVVREHLAQPATSFVATTAHPVESAPATAFRATERPFSREQIDQIVFAINRRPTLREYFAVDPWNRITSVVVFVALSMCFVGGLLLHRDSYAMVFYGLYCSPLYLPMIWSHNPGSRWTGWVLCVLSTIGYPLLIVSLFNR